MPLETKATFYEPNGFGLTENTRFPLTAVSEFGEYRTIDRSVNSLRIRFNRRRSIHRPSHAVLSRFSSHAFSLTVTSLAPFGSDRKYQSRPYSRGTKPGNPRSTFCTGRWDYTAAASVVYSSHGLWSIRLVRSHWLTCDEHAHGRRLLLFHLAGVIIVSVAILLPLN